MTNRNQHIRLPPLARISYTGPLQHIYSQKAELKRKDGECSLSKGSWHLSEGSLFSCWRGQVSLQLLIRYHHQADPQTLKSILEGKSTTALSGILNKSKSSHTHFKTLHFPVITLFPHSSTSLLSFPSTQPAVVFLLQFIPWSCGLWTCAFQDHHSLPGGCQDLPWFLLQASTHEGKPSPHLLDDPLSLCSKSPLGAKEMTELKMVSKTIPTAIGKDLEQQYSRAHHGFYLQC